MAEREVIKFCCCLTGTERVIQILKIKALRHEILKIKVLQKMLPPNSLHRPLQLCILNIAVGTAFITYLYKENKESEQSWRVYRRKCRLK